MDDAKISGSCLCVMPGGINYMVSAYYDHIRIASGHTYHVIHATVNELMVLRYLRTHRRTFNTHIIALQLNHALSKTCHLVAVVIVLSYSGLICYHEKHITSTFLSHIVILNLILISIVCCICSRFKYIRNKHNVQIVE